jgi:hypothetical protein
MANRLTGTRLGKTERMLFSKAASSEAIAPMMLDAEGASRSEQQGLLRASKKLAEAGLIERRRVYREGRAHDLRRERPYFADGRFWIREDSSRRHFASRIAIRRTPFGDEIYQEFMPELRAGRAIRWDDRRVERAGGIASRTGPARRPIEQHDDRFRPPSLAEEEAHEGRSEHMPPQVATGLDRERWRISVRLARAEHPNLGSMRLLEEATALFDSDLLAETLLERAGPERSSSGLTYSHLSGWRHASGVGPGLAEEERS